MWGHYLLTLYRALTRHRLYAALNVLGLAIGIAVFLVLWLDVRFEMSFDRWIPNADAVYRIDTIHSSPNGVRRSANATSMIAPLLKADYPQIVAYTHLLEDDEPITVGRTSDSEQVYFVDPDFFKVLALPLIHGDAAGALSSPANIVISERIARKYFGSTDVVGAHMVASRNGTRFTYQVAAVMKALPANTHLKLDVLVPITPAFISSLNGFENWNSAFGSSYVRFKTAADAHAVQADMVNFLRRRGGGDQRTKLGADPNKFLRIELTPLPAVHFTDVRTENTFGPGADPRVVDSLGVVGVLTLVIAILNYVNLTTARAGLRAREVAVRKVLGATRATLMAQFMAEAMAVALVAVLIGLALTELVLPLVNAAGGGGLAVVYWGAGGILPVLGGLTLLIGLGAGAYPALLLSGFRPAPVLASSRLPGGGRLAVRVRNALVVLQFGAAIAFTVCTLVLSAQAKFMHDADRGFRREGLILVDSLMAPELLQRQPVILDALRSVPGVTLATISNREPAATNLQVTNVGRKGMSSPDPDFTMEVVGPDYFKTYGSSLVAGRPFDAVYGLDESGLSEKPLEAQGMNTILNETGVRALHFADPAAAIGQVVLQGDRIPMTIVGVVRDVRFMSSHQPVGAVFYSYTVHGVANGAAAVRYEGVEPHEMMARLEAAWRRAVPGEPFVAKTADARLSDYYVPDEQRARLFTMGAVLAVGIGCVGLYGLASFTTARRIKEIGIRKTLGASTGDILRLLVGQFLRPVLLANLIAWPLAWLAMRNWLSGFDQRIELGPQYFLAATVLTLLIALGTVAGQAFAVARAEPAKALRHE